MARKDRIIQYVAYSISSDENGLVVYDFHTSNREKYNVWAEMPKRIMDNGIEMRFHWFKLPELTEKFVAIKLLMEHPSVRKNRGVVAMLQSKLSKQRRPISSDNPSKNGRRKNVEGVLVTTFETASGIKKLKETTAKKKATAA